MPTGFQIDGVKVSTIDGKSCLTSLTVYNLPKHLQDWVITNCERPLWSLPLDVWVLPGQEENNGAKSA